VSDSTIDPVTVRKDRLEMKLLHDSTVLVSAAELAEIIGVDLQTVNNWIRRDIISRTPIGGRKLRYRLFSAEEVYKTTFKNELVKLGIPPSSASDAVKALWRQWDWKETSQGRRFYSVLVPSGGKWTLLLCSQNPSGGALHKLGRSGGEIEFPKHAFAVVPISDVFERVTNTLEKLLNTTKR
jgi:hypothetical protein